MEKNHTLIFYNSYKIKTDPKLVYGTVQCRHFIPVLNAWATRAQYTTAYLVVTQLPGHGCDYRFLSSQLNEALFRKIRGSLRFSWHIILGCLYNQALADVRSTGAGIQCLYCSHIGFEMETSWAIYPSKTCGIFLLYNYRLPEHTRNFLTVMAT